MLVTIKAISNSNLYFSVIKHGVLETTTIKNVKQKLPKSKNIKEKPPKLKNVKDSGTECFNFQNLQQQNFDKTGRYTGKKETKKYFLNINFSFN